MVLNESSVLERVRASLTETAVAGGTRLSFRAMGTLCQITVGGVSRERARSFLDGAVHWVADFESRYSRFLPDSLISRISAAAGGDWVKVDAETEQLLAMCHELHFMTRGAFDPTALPLIRLWNWKAQPPGVPDAAAIEAARARVGWRHVQRRKGAVRLPVAGMSLDLGGLGKEYAVDRVLQFARAEGLHSVLVDFGQDIAVGSAPPGRPAWHVGLQDPRDPARCWTSLAVVDRAVATSGDYLRCFEVNGRRYGHIIDPRTGYPVDNGCRAVTVIAPNCTVAGALSTTAFILGPQEGLQLIENFYGAEGCILTDTTRNETRGFNEYVPQ